MCLVVSSILMEFWGTCCKFRLEFSGIFKGEFALKFVDVSDIFMDSGQINLYTFLYISKKCWEEFPLKFGDNSDIFISFGGVYL